MKKLLPSCIIAALLLIPIYSNALESTANAELPVFMSEPTQVITPRLPDAKARQLGSVQVIKPQAASSLSQLLNSVPVLYTQSYGNGQAMNINFRGFSDKTSTLVLLDGVKLNDPQNSSVLWSTVPLDNIDRIELIKGGSAFIYGEGALAGAINIITKKSLFPSSLLPIGLGVDYMKGSNGKTKRTYSAGQSADLFDWALTASNLDGNTFRTNSYFKDDNYFFKSNLKLNMLTLGLQRQYVNSKDRLPGPLTDSQYVNTPEFSIYGPTNFYLEKLWANSAVIQCDLGEYQSAKVQYSDRQRLQSSDIGWGPYIYDIAGKSGVAEYTGKSAGIDYILGGEYSLEDIAVRGWTTSSKRKMAGVYSSAIVPVFDKAKLNLAGRYDRASVTYVDVYTDGGNKSGSIIMSGFSPQVGLSYQISEASTFHADFSRNFKVTPHEDFGAMLKPYLPQLQFKSNLNIEPQVAHNTELGYTYHGETIKFGFNYYYMYLPNEIIFNHQIDTTYGYEIGTNENFKTSHSGEEFNFEWALSKTFAFKTNLVMDRAKFLSGLNKDKKLPYVYSSKFNTSVNVIPVTDLTLRLSYNAFGPYYPLNDFVNLDKQKGYSFINATALYNMGIFELYGGVNNLLNTLYPGSVVVGDYDLLNYYPANRREIYLGVKFKI